MSSDNGLVILVDVDNTLLDNDLVRDRLGERIRVELGASGADQFWAIYEQIRITSGLVDFPTTIERFCRENPNHPPRERIHDIVFGFPFDEVVYHDAAAVVAHLETLGTAVILSDGDDSFQPHKVRASGLERMFQGRVLIFVHKELEREKIEAAFPARHYVMIDDKPRIHPAMKSAFGDRITTVMVNQGHYAHDPTLRGFPGADIVIPEIGAVLDLSIEQLLGAAGAQPLAAG